ncbi:hypothetical protein OGAPHI_002119 [Ogataea philodendri]|uniref:Uncharacterized protein n=1 Tax=Ogataea philodendri TaxID=1378263 RepID=A0A9P8PB74_9ASCO|nr:uncharacterized protein OGAPHI_002119 [Ogataea philodendri]KAH3668365.1 hypothetical protein OGAPHI_002119 [Ogataea philodendri]
MSEAEEAIGLIGNSAEETEEDDEYVVDEDDSGVEDGRSAVEALRAISNGIQVPWIFKKPPRTRLRSGSSSGEESMSFTISALELPMAFQRPVR